jgi:hypothetical protein
LINHHIGANRSKRLLFGRKVGFSAHVDDAKALLQPVFEQFVEGFDTADLEAAVRLSATLG